MDKIIDMRKKTSRILITSLGAVVVVFGAVLLLKTIDAYRMGPHLRSAIAVWRWQSTSPKAVSLAEGSETIFAGDGISPSPDDVETFVGINGSTFTFLESPFLKPAVQFSCAVSPHPYEEVLESALGSQTPELKLQALVVLLRARAPASVHLQWQALNEIEGQGGNLVLRRFLQELKSCFDPQVLEREIQRNPPQDRYSDDPRLSWAIRAAGVTRVTAALPRLVAFCTSTNLDASLAAERSLEDYPGPEGDEALVRCILGWQYDAYVRASWALLARNPRLLHKTLSGIRAPDECRFHQGLFLAKLNDTEAVPILCETVGKYQIIDAEMFREIGRLATDDQRPMIDALPGSVRPEQTYMAEHAVAEFRKRVGAKPSR